MTRRLYYEDQYLREFASRVVRRLESGGRPAVVLEATAFYPTSGGQPHDTGTLNGARVVDVVEQGEEIVHILDKPIDGDEARGAIDWSRRMDHLQQHHGQHLLSEAFVRVAQAETTSFHLGEETCTIDLSTERVTPDDVAAAEALANDIVLENREIAIFQATRDEVSKLPMRKPPQVEGPIRVVRVADFDCSACCGTHPRRTGEVGPILVLGLERARVSFVCGRRAIARARRNLEILKGVGERLSSSRDDLEAAVARILAERAAGHKSLQTIEKELAGYVAASMPADKVVSRVFENRGLKFLQAVANEIVAKPGRIAVLGATGETSSLVLARSKDVAVDLKPIAAEAFKSIEGRGGGSPSFQQGGGPGKNVGEAVENARRKILDS
ncbi:MAG TPA: alanine--tRNA ligase-related protein [Planctomycetota bacterium]|nr:alanine--tRNA ligase-related protein [Planctomycetota bacterium]